MSENSPEFQRLKSSGLSLHLAGEVLLEEIRYHVHRFFFMFFPFLRCDEMTTVTMIQRRYALPAHEIFIYRKTGKMIKP